MAPRFDLSPGARVGSPRALAWGRGVSHFLIASAFWSPFATVTRSKADADLGAWPA